MVIDWFTVGAQALNFAVLIWLLKRFLYKPVLSTIDAREARIAEQILQAKEQNAKAQEERKLYQTRCEEFDAKRAEMLAAATEEVKVERQTLLDRARTEADASSLRRQEDLKSQSQDLLMRIEQGASQSVLAISRKFMTEIVKTNPEDRLVEVFLDRLRALDEGAKENLAQALQDTGDSVLLRSSVTLVPAQREALQNCVRETFRTDREPQFETAPELVFGIELIACGQKFAWSIDEFLGNLGQEIEALREIAPA